MFEALFGLLVGALSWMADAAYVIGLVLLVLAILFIVGGIAGLGILAHML